MTVKNKPKCKLIGEDGNVFSLLGIASKALKKKSLWLEAEEMNRRVMDGAANYEDALAIIMEYVDVY
jgi:hypothetical protein